MEMNSPFEPSQIRPWHGPAPDERQVWLLRACLAPLDEARRSWRCWREQCDFDHESSVSHELASLAAFRLAEQAGDCSIALRSRGLHRRSWFLSQLALEATGRIAESCQAESGTLLARGDLAMALIGPTFKGRPFPIRSLRFALAEGGTDQGALQALLAADAGVAGGALNTGLLRLEKSAASSWLWEASQVAQAPYSSLRVLPLPLLLAELVASNWRWGPSGGLRWVLELVRALEEAPDPDALAAGIVTASVRLGSIAALQAATETLAPLLPSCSLESLTVRLKGVPISRRSLWRLKATTAPPSSWQHRSLRLLDQLRTHMNHGGMW